MLPEMEEICSIGEVVLAGNTKIDTLTRTISRRGENAYGRFWV